LEDDSSCWRNMRLLAGRNSTVSFNSQGFANTFLFLFFVFFFFCFRIGVWTQGLSFAGQAFYHLRNSTRPFLVLGIFDIGSLGLFACGFQLQSSCSLPLE
jgi:hypothetical protein